MNRARPQVTKSPESTEAWILGSGLASLASALYLVQQAKLPASNVHILDSHDSMEQVAHHIGDRTHGYDLPAGCLPFPLGEPLEELLNSIPLPGDEGYTLLKEIKSWEARRGHAKTTHRTRFMIGKDGKLDHRPTKSLGLRLKSRLDLISFLCKGERRMGRRRIEELLPNAFFQSTFWAIWTTQFGFQPWHSAIEFKRAIRQYLRRHNGLSILNCLDLTGYYRYEFICVSIFLYLQNLGVDFHFDTLVTNITMTSQDGNDRISQLELVENGFQSQKAIDVRDIIIVTLGSTVSGTGTGTNESSPLLDFKNLKGELDENWLLWLEIGDQDPKFGNPYNFCTRQFESLMVSFTITTRDPRLHEILESLANGITDDGIFISVPDSPWNMNLCLPAQPVVKQQPPNIRVMWGFAVCPRRGGSFINKPMTACSGTEILTELFNHLGFPLSTQHTVTVPRVMPRMWAMLLVRSPTDRPTPTPMSTTNIGLVGPFVDIPNFTCADPSYDVRTAEIAVSNLMGLPVSKPRNKNQPMIDMLRLLFWK